MSRRLVFVALVLLAALFSGCIQTAGVGPRAELAVLKQELVKDSGGTPTVLVTIKNVSGVTAELAEVKVRFYDAKKNLIDGATDSVLNLKPNGTWDFTFTCSGDRCSEVKSYETEVTAGTSSGGF